MKHSHRQAPAPAGSSRSSADSHADTVVSRAAKLVESGQSQKALGLLTGSKINTDAIRNARGVCLMRMGRTEEALQVFRSLVLSPGGTWMKQGLPVIFQTNFCTALLMAGHPAGCRDSLAEIAEQGHPSVVRVREALKRWERGLSWGQWLIWKFGSEPDTPVTLGFEPGEFFDAPPIAPSDAPAASGDAVLRVIT